MDFADLYRMYELLEEARECRRQLAVLPEGYQRESRYLQLQHAEAQYSILWHEARDFNLKCDMRQLCAIMLRNKNR